MDDPKSEQAAARRAVHESLQAGAITDELAKLVHRMAKKRCTPQLAEDMAQHVLLGLHRHLGKLDPATAHNYIGVAIIKTWQHHMRGRRAEQRYTVRLAAEMADEFPPAARSGVLAAYLRSALNRYKYY